MLSAISHRKGSRLATACAIVGTLGVSCLGALWQGFVTADDPMQMLIASGAMTAGQGDVHTVYSNVLIMWPLVALLAEWPGFNWYTANLVAAHLLGSLALVYIVLGAPSSRWAAVFLLFLLVGFDAGLLVNLQFTHAAAAAAAAGLALLLVAGEERTQVRGESLAGLALAFYGSLVRADGFFLAALLFAPLFAVRAFARGLRTLVWPALTAVLVVASIGVDRIAYSSDPSWRPFLEFRPQMLRLFNEPKRVTGGTELEAALARVGWSVNDWRLFVDYRFVADEKAYSTQSVGSLADDTSAPRSVRQALGFLWLQKSAFAFIPAIVLLAAVCLGGGSRRQSRLGDPLEDRRAAVLGLLGGAGCAAVASLYLVWAERLPRHVRLPLVYVLAVMVVVACLRHAPAWGRNVRLGRATFLGMAAALATTLVLAIALLVRDVTANRLDRQMHADIRSRLMSDRGAVYYLGNLEYLRTYPPWQAPDASGRRVFPAIEFARTPLSAPVLDAVEAATVIEAIGAGDPVVVVAKPELVELLQAHLRDHHGVSRVVEPLGTVGEGKPGERDRRIVAVRFRAP